MTADPDPTSPAEITARAVASFEGCADPRLRELMQAFVSHLHAFATEVGLGEDEWRALIGALTDTGHITDERRQEFILWSDTLGLSMLVDALARPADGATESTVLGPFYAAGAPLRAYGASMAEEAAGTPAWVHGRVRATTGEPIAGADLDVWQNGADRLYAVQRPEAPEDHLRGRYRTRDDGSFAFVAVRPEPYPIPDDGPVGRMLAATGEALARPAVRRAQRRRPRASARSRRALGVARARPRAQVAARAADAARRRLISREATTAITRIAP